MATYWANKDSLPSVSEVERLSPIYVELSELQSSSNGVSVAQGVIDVFGVIEMLAALHYHYLQFVRVIQRNIRNEIPVLSPEERYEAVSYINRVGQYHYFCKSAFATNLVGDVESQIQTITRPIPFRHKYTAHRERDKPKFGTNEANQYKGEMALGKLGGHLPCERVPGDYARLPQIVDEAFDDQQRRRLAVSYVLFQIFLEKGHLEFNMEIEHPKIMTEAMIIVLRIVEKAKESSERLICRLAICRRTVLPAAFAIPECAHTDARWDIPWSHPR